MFILCTYIIIMTSPSRPAAALPAPERESSLPDPPPPPRQEAAQPAATWTAMARSAGPLEALASFYILQYVHKLLHYSHISFTILIFTSYDNIPRPVASYNIIISFTPGREGAL